MTLDLSLKDAHMAAGHCPAEVRAAPKAKQTCTAPQAQIGEAQALPPTGGLPTQVSRGTVGANPGPGVQVSPAALQLTRWVALEAPEPF